MCGTRNFVSMRLYSAPHSHLTIVAILEICLFGRSVQAGSFAAIKSDPRNSKRSNFENRAEMGGSPEVQRKTGLSSKAVVPVGSPEPELRPVRGCTIHPSVKRDRRDADGPPRPTPGPTVGPISAKRTSLTPMKRNASRKYGVAAAKISESPISSRAFIPMNLTPAI